MLNLRSDPVTRAMAAVLDDPLLQRHPKEWSCQSSTPSSSVRLWIAFRAIIEQVIDLSRQACAQFESSPAASYAASELLEIAVAVAGQKGRLDRPRSRSDDRRVPRQEIIRRCLQFMEGRQNEPVRLLSGWQLVGCEVSERTLRSAFKEYFGVGPVQYLRLRQLNQVHRALRAARCRCSIRQRRAHRDMGCGSSAVSLPVTANFLANCRPRRCEKRRDSDCTYRLLLTAWGWHASTTHWRRRIVFGRLFRISGFA